MKFSCCSPNLAIGEVYNGGATFMAFLAAEFGEDIHARLLRNPAQTFGPTLTLGFASAHWDLSARRFLRLLRLSAAV